MNFKKLFLFLFIKNIYSFNINRRILLANTGPLINIKLAKDSSPDEPNLNIQPQTTYIQEETNDIYFYGPVTPETCFALKNKINEITSKSKRFSINYNSPPFPINLHIQSGGGSLFPCLYIIDLIKNNDGIVPIYTFIDGYAASAATLISVVGTRRFMTKNSLMLIHQLSSSTDAGKYSEIKDQVQNMDSLMQIIINTYRQHTKIKDEDLFELLQKDLWLNSTQCLKFGLVDEII